MDYRPAYILIRLVAEGLFLSIDEEIFFSKISDLLKIRLKNGANAKNVGRVE